MTGKLIMHLRQGTILSALKHVVKKKIKRFLRDNSFGRWFLLRFNRSQGRCHISKAEVMNIDISDTCNLSCVMCVYEQTRNENKFKKMMSLELFKKVFDSVVKIGYKDIELCPAKGELFLNKNIWPILEYADSANIHSLKVVTNFIPIRQTDIIRFFNLNKLKLLEISIYGFDPDSFKLITRKGRAQFNKLISNLDILNQIIDSNERTFQIHFRWWIGDLQEFNASKSKYKQYIRTLGKKIDRLDIKEYADNRAGMISKINVSNTGVKVRSASSKFSKCGPCRYLFTDFIINSDLSISTCRCYDHTGKLFLGYFDEKPLSHILSGHNQLFNRIVTEQEQGIYRDPCSTCSQYKSIYFPGGNCLEYQQLKKNFNL